MFFLCVVDCNFKTKLVITIGNCDNQVVTSCEEEEVVMLLMCVRVRRARVTRGVCAERRRSYGLRGDKRVVTIFIAVNTRQYVS